MATYKEIKGATIQTRDSDPVIGGVAGGSFSSGGNLNTPRGNAGASGLQTAALYFGGDGPAGPAIANTEQYDGSSWTEVNDLNVARGQQFFSNQGTQTAALSATGSPVQTSVESWNGSSWTETTDLNTARRNGASLGTQTAMVGTGGWNGSAYVTLTEIWNGSSWTETGDCPDAKFVSRGGGGTTTAGIIAGSYPNGDVDSSQTWDGSTWTDGPNINTGRSGIAFSAASQSSALGHGGGVGTPQAAQTKTEFFAGTSWTELADLATASQQGGGAGNSSTGIHYGGYGPGALTTTEEWTTAPVTAAILTEGSVFLSGGTTLKGFGKAAGIPSGVWASGGNLNQAKYSNVTMGSNTEAVTYGGYKESPNAILDQTENYNGTSWTEVNEMNTARFNHAGAGVYSSAIAFGGEKSGPANATETETWNGTSWTEVNDLNTARRVAAGSGDSSTSALCFGGYPNPSGALTELWDGTSWTEVNDLNTSRYQLMGVGTSTNALGVGGNPARAINEKWNGTSWTEVNDINTGRQAGISGGTIGIALIAGGSPNKTETESWNGTSWTEQNDLSTGRGQTIGGGVSPAVAAIMAGGEPPAPGIGASTEEWTVDATLSDVTVS